MKPPLRLTNDEADDRPTAWTADSKAVFFESNSNGTYGLYKQGIGQGNSELVFTGPQDVSYPRASADNGSLLFLEIPRTLNNPGFPYRLMRIPVSGGAPQFVLQTRNTVDFWCAHAAGGLCAIFEISQDRKQLLITAFDLEKGRGSPLRTIENDPPHIYGHVGLSSDGLTFAISRVGEPEIHIRLLSVSGGSEREFTVKGWPNITGLDWSPDGKGLYCGSQSPQGGTLLYVDLTGNARVLWQNKSAHAGTWGVPSPDGRYLAIGGYVNNANVWTLEDF